MYATSNIPHIVKNMCVMFSHLIDIFLSYINQTVIIISKCWWKLFNFSFKFKNIYLFVLILLMLIRLSLHHDSRFVTEWTFSLIGLIVSQTTTVSWWKAQNYLEFAKRRYCWWWNIFFTNTKFHMSVFLVDMLSMKKVPSILNHSMIYATVVVWIQP